MPYIATRSRTVAGVAYSRGDEVDTSTLSVEKLATLVRVGLLIPADQGEVRVEGSRFAADPLAAAAAEREAPPAEVPDTELCPECGEGPFRNLRLHITRVHEDDLSEEDPLDGD